MTDTLGLEGLTLTVQSVANSVEFYGGKLGLPVEYQSLPAFAQPPHDEPWERAMTAFDPDGYAVEFSQGKRGKNAPPPPGPQ